MVYTSYKITFSFSCALQKEKGQLLFPATWIRKYRFNLDKKSKNS